MACAYCATNLTIPKHLRTKTISIKAKPSSKAKPISVPENEAAKLLRKAQPIAVKAWNFYAVWTWLMRLLPACLVVFIVGIFICLALGALPFVLNLLR
jgi:hypothetical protein